MAKESRARAVLGGSKPKSKSGSSHSKSKSGKKVHKMHISRSEGDKHYLVEHEAPPSDDGMPGMAPGAPNVISSPEEMAAHLGQHMPLAPPEEPAAGPPAGGAPPAAAGV